MTIACKSEMKTVGGRKRILPARLRSLGGFTATIHLASPALWSILNPAPGVLGTRTLPARR